MGLLRRGGEGPERAEREEEDARRKESRPTRLREGAAGHDVVKADSAFLPAIYSQPPSVWGRLPFSLSFYYFQMDASRIITPQTHGTRFEMMAILVKAPKCATKRLRAFP